jgi:DNA-binding CsgD family transcriptional regulator
MGGSSHEIVARPPSANRIYEWWVFVFRAPHELARAVNLGGARIDRERELLDEISRLDPPGGAPALALDRREPIHLTSVGAAESCQSACRIVRSRSRSTYLLPVTGRNFPGIVIGINSCTRNRLSEDELRIFDSFAEGLPALLSLSLDLDTRHLQHTLTQVATLAQRFRDRGTRCEEDAADPPADLATLTSREEQLFFLLRRGKGTSEMADVMEISPNTVKKHLANIFRKLGVGSRIELLTRFPHA